MARLVAASFRAEALDLRQHALHARGSRLTAHGVMVAMQIAMVVTNLGRFPILSTEERDFPIAFNELCLGVMLMASAFAMPSWRRLRFDRVALVALLFAAIGAGSAFASVDKLNLDAFELFV